LASVQGKLTDIEISRLKVTNLFTKEEVQATADSDQQKKLNRYKASDLYAPSEALRALGMPLIDWPSKHKWRNTSDEGMRQFQNEYGILTFYLFFLTAKFLFRLGLRTHIPLHDLFTLASVSTPEIRSKLLAYFMDNWKDVYASIYSPSAIQVPFLPTADDPKKLCKPTEIFADAR
jgi:hypothetical protein